MPDQFDLKQLGLGELAAATGTVGASDLIIVVDPTTKVPRLETKTNVKA